MKRSDLTGFAVDFGGTKIAAARFVGGKIDARLQIATASDASLERQVESIAWLLEELGHRSGAPTGVAATGRITRDGIWSAVNRGTLPAIAGGPFSAVLTARLGPVALLNDAAAASLAEALLGAGVGAAHFAYLTVSTGIGGGIVLKGRLLRSDNGLAGHVGFMSSPLGESLCDSGRVGTVESVAGGRAIAASAGRRAVDARDVFSQAQAGEGWAEAIVARSASAVAMLIADLTACLGLDRVAIGGSIGLAPGYLEWVRCKLLEMPELFRTEIVPAVLGQDSALFGALTFELVGDSV